ncbi:leader peptidase (prepilin peptidase)/N-methyltransferase [Motilibacter rhizosphaerae]|uniref:Prepilin leader peptidase/N-methyltransferase n=1 Tax=Motilibacter rhizosphaerae TaxID=598652 RepID=A0A4Q7NQT7_9ACTN|nr:A24 family peptidase [Motilibacter rhizosphaerae]RZS89416.1 leader peptidase (prepilin peptidase)/N-methyltransferase [Motilibacter rhizosphaerae]
MTGILVTFAAILGLAVGSFLNVVVHRVPLGESVVSPPSRCPGCETRIRPLDNVPVLSWLLLRGKCRTCRCRISPRYPLVEVGTGALFAGLAAHFGAAPELPAFLYLAAVGLALALIDLDCKRLPNALVLPSYPVAIVLLALAVAGPAPLSALLRALVCGVALFLVFLGIALVKPGGMGFGDVKLAGLLGCYLGWVGWDSTVVGGFLPFLLGGAVGLVLMALRRAGRRSAIPFGPFMVAGAMIAVVAGQPVGHAYASFVLG